MQNPLTWALALWSSAALRVEKQVSPEGAVKIAEPEKPGADPLFCAAPFPAHYAVTAGPAQLVRTDEVPSAPTCELQRTDSGWQCCADDLATIYDCRDDARAVSACAAALGLGLDEDGNDEEVAAAALRRAGGSADDEPCYTSVEGEECHGHVLWAMTTGIHRHPELYQGLTAASSFVEFQDRVRHAHPSCSRPCDVADERLAAPDAPEDPDEEAAELAALAELASGLCLDTDESCAAPVKVPKPGKKRKALLLAGMLATAAGAGLAGDLHRQPGAPLEPYVSAASRAFGVVPGADRIRWAREFHALEQFREKRRTDTASKIVTILGLANHARNSRALRWPESPKDALGVVKGVVGYKGKRPVLTYLVGSAAQLGVKRLAVWSVRRFRSQRNADYKKFKEEEFHFLRKYSGPEAEARVAFYQQLGVAAPEEMPRGVVLLQAFRRWRAQQRQDPGPP